MSPIVKWGGGSILAIVTLAALVPDRDTGNRTTSSVTGAVAAGPTEPKREDTIAEVPFRSPEGLKWGDEREEVVRVLGKTMRHIKTRKVARGVDGPGEEATFSGRFLRQKTRDFAVEFKDGKMIGMAASLASNDIRPAARRWEDWVEAATSIYGPPLKVNKNPYNIPSTFDFRIISGDWKPFAEWRFAGNSSLRIVVMVSDPDSSGNRSLSPTLAAIDDDHRFNKK